MGELEEAEVKGLQDVLVFQLCECDAVAAYSLEEAKVWYKNLTGLSDTDLYPYEEVDIIPLDYQVYKEENSLEKVMVSEIIQTYWDGEPFIAITTYM